MVELYQCPQGHVSSVTRFPNDQGVRRCFFCPSVVHSVGQWGDPVVAMPITTLEMLTNSLETAQKDSVEAVIRYIHTLNDLYHWNEWVCERLSDRFID